MCVGTISYGLGPRAKHWAHCVWVKCESHMEGKDRHYYPSGPHYTHASSPFYSISCFITFHHPKRRYEDRWAIPPAFTDDDGYLFFHTIINTHDRPSSNHPAQEEALLVRDATVDYDDPFPWSTLWRNQHQAWNNANQAWTKGPYASIQILQIGLATCQLDIYEKWFQSLYSQTSPLPDEPATYNPLWRSCAPSSCPQKTLLCDCNSLGMTTPSRQQEGTNIRCVGSLHWVHVPHPSFPEHSCCWNC